MKLDTYFERDDESGRAILPPPELLQLEAEEREADRARMGFFGWMLLSAIFTFAVVTMWAVS